MSLCLRMEFTAGSSSKFWELVQKGSQTTVTFGAIGGPPKSSVKNHAGVLQASAFAESMVVSKIKKGYVHAGKAKSKAGATGAKLSVAKAKASVKAKGKVIELKIKKSIAAGGIKNKFGKSLLVPTICFTGSLPIQRSAAASYAKARGYAVTSGVSANTNILVVGEGAGSKIAKCPAGVTIWSWAQFKKKVGNPPGVELP